MKLPKASLSSLFDFSFYKVDQGWYVDTNGKEVAVDDLCDPSYTPCVKIPTLQSELFAVVNLVSGCLYYCWSAHDGGLVRVGRSRRFGPVFRKLVKIKFLVGCPVVLPVPEFLRFAFPLIRRSWPSLVSTDLVSVQPMSFKMSSLLYENFAKYGISGKGGKVS